MGRITKRNFLRLSLPGLIVAFTVAAVPGLLAYAQPKMYWEIKFIKAGGLAKLKVGGANGKLVKFKGHGEDGITWTREDKQETMDITPYFDANATDITLYAELSTKDGEGDLLLIIEVHYGGIVVDSWNVIKQDDTRTFKRKS